MSDTETTFDVIVEVRDRVTGRVLFVGSPKKGETLALDWAEGQPARLRCDITDLSSERSR